MASSTAEQPRRTFEAKASGDCANFSALFVFFDGETGAAIGTDDKKPTRQEGRRARVGDLPQFVSQSAGMTATDHNGRAAWATHHHPVADRCTALRPNASNSWSEVLRLAESLRRKRQSGRDDPGVARGA